VEKWEDIRLERSWEIVWVRGGGVGPGSRVQGPESRRYGGVASPIFGQSAIRPSVPPQATISPSRSGHPGSLSPTASRCRPDFIGSV